MAFFSFPSQINEHAARLVAGTVALTGAASLVFGLRWVIPLLAIGFVLRVSFGPRFSPLAKLAMTLAPKLWEPVPVFGAPKRFAQGVGAVFTVTASALLFTGHATAGWALIGTLVVFASLEAALAFCMGCWVYGRLQAAGLIPPDACVDCAPISRTSA